jgi:hypothetical protein
MGWDNLTIEKKLWEIWKQLKRIEVQNKKILEQLKE